MRTFRANKRKHSSIWTKTLSLVVASIVVFTFVAGTVPAFAVNTGPADPKNTLDWEVKSWWYARTLEKCFAESFGGGPVNGTSKTVVNLDATNVEGGTLFSNSGGLGNESVYIYGSYMSEEVGDIGVGDDNYGSCESNQSEVVKEALSHWGISALELICSPEMQAQGVYKRLDGGDCNDSPAGFANIDNGKAAKGFINYITANVYDGNPIPKKDGSDLTAAQKYKFWWQSLVNACVVKDGMDGRTTVPGGAYSQRFQIQTSVSPTSGNQPIYQYYVAAEGKSRDWGTSQQRNALGVMIIEHGHATPDGTRVTCATMENNANKNYTGYATFVSANPEATIDASGIAASGNPAEPEVSCEATGGPLNWLLCGLWSGAAGLADWLLTSAIAPSLKVEVIDTSATGNGDIYNVWSNFRIYGNIFLVLVLLVVVFGQAIGGGLLDAYTAKKALPRLLAGAILINLSIYIVALLVDVFNVVGGGITQLINTPLGDSSFGFQMDAAEQTIQVVQGATVGTIAGFAGAALFVGGGLGSAAAFVGLFVLLPAVLSLIGVFLVLIIRKAAILGLIFVAPVAFALWCLPNTAKYFKMWWDTLFKMLLVYPIIIAMFAIANVLSVVMADNSGGGIEAAVAVILPFLPLFMIPFAFKLSGGILGQLSDFMQSRAKQATEAVKGHANDPLSLRNQVKQGVARDFQLGKARQFTRNSALSKKSGFMGLAGRVGASVYGIGPKTLEEVDAGLTAEATKRIDGIVNSGGDSFVRAYWARKGADGKWRSATNGKEYSQAEVDQARQFIHGDKHMVQAAAQYEVRKANDTEFETNTNPDGVTSAGFRSVFAERMNDNKFTKEESNGIWTGVKFTHQGTRLDLKYMGMEEDAAGQIRFKDNVDHNNMSVESTEKLRSYDFANQRANYFDEMSNAFNPGSGASPAALERYRRLARDLERNGSLGGVLPGDGDPATARAGGTAAANRGTGGSEASNAAAQRFIAIALGRPLPPP